MFKHFAYIFPPMFFSHGSFITEMTCEIRILKLAGNLFIIYRDFIHSNAWIITVHYISSVRIVYSWLGMYLLKCLLQAVSFSKSLRYLDDTGLITDNPKNW